MTSIEYNKTLSTFNSSNLAVSAYPQTMLINAEDCDGTVQSYYASTGTAIFRMSNDKFDKRRMTVRNMRPEKFIELCSDFYSDEIFKKLGDNK